MELCHLKLNLPQIHMSVFSHAYLFSPKYMQKANLAEVIDIYIGQTTDLYVSIIVHRHQPANELRMLWDYKQICRNAKLSPLYVGIY